VRLRASAVLLVALIACSPAARPGTEPTSTSFSADEIQAAAAKLRADPNLGGEKKIRSLRWVDSKAQTPPNAPAWVVGLFQFLGQSARVSLWVAGVIAAAIAAIWLIRTLFARMPAGKAQRLSTVSRVGDMDIRPDSLPEDVGAAALELLEAGRTRDALSLLYRGALSRVVHRFGVAIGESYTEREALRAVRAKLDPPRAAYFSDIVGIWQRAVYAGEAVAREPIAQLCRNFLPTLDEVAAA
jgi:Domain of unknown function (DUF4129)